MNNITEEIPAQLPSETTEPRVGEVASGIPAIVQTMRFGFGEMGAIRTLKVLTTINQKNGFDCPSCA